jgi:6-pyruvoyl-tetrahydropterin synthase
MIKEQYPKELKAQLSKSFLNDRQSRKAKSKPSNEQTKEKIVKHLRQAIKLINQLEVK